MYFTTFKKNKVFLYSACVALIITLSFIFPISGSVGVFYGKAVKELPIYYVKTEEKKIAISFDCAWGVDYTDELLSIMAQEEVKCTFFTVEFWAKKYPEYLTKIHENGHDIGTHSSTHPYMSKLNKETIIKELSTSSSVIEQVVGVRPILFRPPYGDYNDLLIKTAKELGLYTIQWDVDSLDWKDISAREITERVVKRVKNGSIVLFHNQGLHTAKALPQIIKKLKAQGYKFVKISELIYKDNYQMSIDGGQFRNS